MIKSYKWILVILATVMGVNHAAAQVTTIDFSNGAGVYSTVPPGVENVYMEDGCKFETPVATNQHFDTGPNGLLNGEEVLIFHELAANTVNNIITLTCGGAAFDFLTFDLAFNALVLTFNPVINSPMEVKASDGSMLTTPLGSAPGFVGTISPGWTNVTWVTFDIVTNAISSGNTVLDNVVVDISSETPLAAKKDSFVNRALLHTNEGANPRLIVGKKEDRRRRAVLSFKPADIDDFITANGLTSATLVLTIAENDGNWGSTGRPVQARPLLRKFKEGNGKWVGVSSAERIRGSGRGVTWRCAVDRNISNRRRNCANPWNGGKFAEATAPKVVHTNGLTGEVMWDVTDDVLAGTVGWVIKKKNERRNGQVRYYSKEGAAEEGNPNLAPRLILE